MESPDTREVRHIYPHYQTSMIHASEVVRAKRGICSVTFNVITLQSLKTWEPMGCTALLGAAYH